MTTGRHVGYLCPSVVEFALWEQGHVHASLARRSTTYRMLLLMGGTKGIQYSRIAVMLTSPEATNFGGSSHHDHRLPRLLL